MTLFQAFAIAQNPFKFKHIMIPKCNFTNLLVVKSIEHAICRTDDRVFLDH
jgi:hypothetical protein